MSEGKATRPAQRSSTTVRVVVLVVVIVVAAAASIIAVVRHGSGQPSAAGSGLVAPGIDGNVPQLLFRSTKLDRDFGSIAVVPQANPSALRSIAPLKCARVDFGDGTGLCLTVASQGLISHTTAKIFDSKFNVVHKFDVDGIPSRARVSPDGRYGATTAFVSGDSYASSGFSTRTTIYDLQARSKLFDLEKLSVTKDGHPFHSGDFNFWGVTFIPNSTGFYATLGTGGNTYLIKGDIDTREAEVVRSGVECPSLSPDGKRIAFKERNGGPTITWHLAVLDLATMQEHVIGDRSVNVDDQVSWLDDNTVMYAVPADPNIEGKVAKNTPGAPTLGTGASFQTDTYTIDANAESTPKLLLSGSWSAVPVDAS